MQDVLRVENLIRNYEKPSRSEEKEEIKVLKGLNLSVKGIMGKSGCGKSTLLKVLGMIDRPTDGTMFFKDKEIKKLWNDELSDIRRREVGFVFQDFYLMDSLSVDENIMLPMILDKADEEKCRCFNPFRNSNTENIKYVFDWNKGYVANRRTAGRKIAGTDIRNGTG